MEYIKNGQNVLLQTHNSTCKFQEQCLNLMNDKKCLVLFPTNYSKWEFLSKIRNNKLHCYKTIHDYLKNENNNYEFVIINNLEDIHELKFLCKFKHVLLINDIQASMFNHQPEVIKLISYYKPIQITIPNESSGCKPQM